MDPAWITGGVHNGKFGSRVAVVFNKVGPLENIDGQLAVGNASQLALGTTNLDWLSNALDLTKSWGVGVTAALGIFAPQNLDAVLGHIIVDGTLPAAPAFAANTATFTKDSLLVVNAAAGLGANVALTAAAGTLNVNTDAKLMVVGGKANDVVNIVTGFTAGGAGSIAAGGWNADGSAAANLITDSHLLTASSTLGVAPFAGAYSVRINQVSAATVFPQLQGSTAGLVDAMVAQVGIQTESPNAGVRFVSRAVADTFGLGAAQSRESAKTIEGGLQLGTVAATQASTFGASTVATSAATSRTSIANPSAMNARAVALNMDNTGNVTVDSGLAAGDGLKNGFGIWLMPLFQNSNVHGVKAGRFETGYNSNLYGISLGADYTIDSMFRFGLALNLGGGNGTSTGDFRNTTNNFNFWGLNLYGGWAQNNFGITGDVGFTGNYNKVEQDVPASLQMPKLKSDIEATAWTAGLRGEYKFETDALDITPHVGVRFTGINTHAYDVKSGGTVFKVDQEHQALWTFPVGVTFSKDIETNSGWVFKPQLDLGVIAAAGDVYAKTRSSIPGVGGKTDLEIQVVDHWTFDGGAGFEMKKDNVAFGLNYNLQLSEHRTGHGVFGTVRFEF